MGAKGDPSEPKSMYLETPWQLVNALSCLDITCRGEGDGKLEFGIIDDNFRGHIRFKDFCKFVKNHRKGIAYEDSDSSASTEEVFEEVVKEIWREMDPDRKCYVSIDVVALQMGKLIGQTDPDF